jgi:hypothetical protein
MGEGIIVCLNCRASWRTDGTPPGDGKTASPRARADRLPAPAYRFTARELERLAAYRAAVRAGLYNEGYDGLRVHDPRCRVDDLDDAA